MLRRLGIVALILGAVLAPGGAHGQTAGQLAAADAYYTDQAKRQPATVGASATVIEWRDDTTLLFSEEKEGRFRYRLLDARTGAVSDAFDHRRLAKALAAMLGTPVAADALDLGRIELLADGARFDRDDSRVECTADRCRKIASRGDPRDFAAWPWGTEIAGEPGPFNVRSPDGRYEVFGERANLMLRDRRNADTRALTADGVENFAYGDGLSLSFGAILTLARAGLTAPASVLWSPDSQRLLSFRTDVRKVALLPIVEHAVAPGVRPRLSQYPYAFSGDKEVPAATFVIFEPASGRRVDVALPPLYFDSDPIRAKFAWWGDRGRSVYVLEHTRDGRTAVLWRVDADTGAATEVRRESAATYIEPAQWPNPFITNIPGTTDIIWYSQADDHGSLYRYDGRGKLRNRLTPRGIFVREVVRVDGAGGWIYLLAGSERAGADPYDVQFYRVRPDGSGLALIDKTRGAQDAQLSPGGRFVATTTTRIDAPAGVSVYRTDGRLVKTLAAPRWSNAASAEIGERFKVKGRDGVTDIYGVLFRPHGFDPARRYPVVHYVYGGPSINFTPHAADDYRARFARSLNALGLAVLFVDGMGSGGRTKSFNEVGTGARFNDCGLPDAIVAMRTLAATRPWLDIERAGMIGHSGGGYCTLSGMLDHPEVFKVGVSSAGSHDQRLVGTVWGDTYIGLEREQPQLWQRQSNISRIASLKGRLLLVHGDIDDDTIAANTLQVVDALIKADKQFDMLLVPGANHWLWGVAYVRHAMFRHLVGHLDASALDQASK